MESNCIIIIHEIVKILEPKPVMFISIVPFFQFSIGLWMLDASFDVFDFILLKKVLKSVIRISVHVSLIGCVVLDDSSRRILAGGCVVPKVFRTCFTLEGKSLRRHCKSRSVKEEALVFRPERKSRLFLPISFLSGDLCRISASYKACIYIDHSEDGA